MHPAGCIRVPFHDELDGSMTAVEFQVAEESENVFVVFLDYQGLETQHMERSLQAASIVCPKVTEMIVFQIERGQRGGSPQHVNKG